MEKTLKILTEGETVWSSHQHKSEIGLEDKVQINSSLQMKLSNFKNMQIFNTLLLQKWYFRFYTDLYLLSKILEITLIHIRFIN